MQRNNYIKFGNFFVLFVLLLMFESCGGIKPYYCFKDKMKEININWGVIVKDKIFLTHSMQSNGLITLMNADSSVKRLGHLNDSLSCKIFGEINRAMLKVQACMDPGDTVRFLTIVNPVTDLFIRTRWNPNFNSENSKILNQLYVNLESYIKIIN